MDKTCSNCKNHKTCHADLLGLGAKMPEGMLHYAKGMFVKCEKGNNREVVDWWLMNGTKKGKEERTQMDCFEPTEPSKLLTGLIEATQGMIDILDEAKKSTVK